MLKKRLGTEAIERVSFLRYYYKIPSTLIIPEGCKKIGGFTFCDCNMLKKVVILGSVEKIEVDAFLNCKSLEEVEIPESVKEIEEQAFCRCRSLEKVIIPENVEIGVYAFYGCSYVKEETRT